MDFERSESRDRHSPGGERAHELIRWSRMERVKGIEPACLFLFNFLPKLKHFHALSGNEVTLKNHFACKDTTSHRY